MTPAIADAIEELRQTFEMAAVTVREDGEGGAFVRIEPLDPGAPYVEREAWVGFRITGQYPYADVYPLFIGPHLNRADGGPLGDALTDGVFDGQTAVQVSRRQNHPDPTVDTAALKVLKVLNWLASR